MWCIVHAGIHVSRLDGSFFLFFVRFIFVSLLDGSWLVGFFGGGTGRMVSIVSMGDLDWIGFFRCNCMCAC